AAEHNNNGHDVSGPYGFHTGADGLVVRDWTVGRHSLRLYRLPEVLWNQDMDEKRPDTETRRIRAEAERIQTAEAERIQTNDAVGEEWAEWYRMTPQERFRESMKLWDTYLALGGSLEPEPDPQSPFFDEDEWRANSAHGRPGVRVLRRGGVQSRP